MKLGLLVLLAVAVVGPSLSEGRIVSKCELREKLGRALILPRRLQRFKEEILAIAICQLNRKSHLHTELVRVFGKRRTTTAKPTTTGPIAARPTTARPTTTVSSTTTPTTTEPTTTTPTTTEPTTTTPTTTEPTTTRTTTARPTTTRPTTTASTTTRTTTTEPTTTRTTTTESTTFPSKPLESNSTFEQNQTILDAGNLRQKRAADETSEDQDKASEEPDDTSEEPDETREEPDETREEPDETREEPDETSDGAEMDKSLEELLSEEENEFGEEEMGQDDENEESDDGEEDEQELEEGGKRKKRSLRHFNPRRKWRPRSIGFYGLFQLNDSYFCNSGYRWSRNKCRTACTAFTDDNIMDDINCIVKTKYWRAIVQAAPAWCYYTQNFFNECN